MDETCGSCVCEPTAVEGEVEGDVAEEGGIDETCDCVCEPTIIDEGETAEEGSEETCGTCICEPIVNRK